MSTRSSLAPSSAAPHPAPSRSSEGTPSSDGLAGVVAASTLLSSVDGARGELLLRGVPVEQIAPVCTFEEMVTKLLNVEDAGPRLARHRVLPEATVDLLRRRTDVSPMDALRMGVSSLVVDPGCDRDESALRLLARIPTIVATHHRLRRGLEPPVPDQEPGLARAYLHCLEGSDPRPARVRALDTYLNTVCDHGMNASTFTARVIVSTGSDLVSALTGAVGALKGPLHGGAPGPALDTVFEIGRAERARDVLERKLDAGERLMGFGHRVYRVRDPRADVLAEAARELAASGEQEELYRLAIEVERVALELLAERKPGRSIQTNVEFFTALLLHCVGLETDLFSPTFAVGRSAGWLAHCFEQIDHGRLIRPQSIYVGPRPDEGGGAATG